MLPKLLLMLIIDESVREGDRVSVVVGGEGEDKEGVGLKVGV